MVTTSCLTPASIRELLSGLLDEGEAVRRDEHLASCASCLAELKRQLAVDDTLSPVVIGQSTLSTESPGPAVNALIQRLRGLCLTRPDDGDSERTLGVSMRPDGETETAWDFLSPPQAPDEIGRLGGYRILGVLGHGGMGVVFRAEDVALQRFVAIKAMLPALAVRASARKRFVREAQLAAGVKHDHIVTIHQVGEDRGVPFLAMEFLYGEPLNVRLERDKTVPVAEAVRIGREIAEGLAAAHDAGLIHRDIKPANVWLETSPRDARLGIMTARVKILDFGLARAIADDQHLTQAGIIVGTPAFMAPEQTGGRPVDARCDLFSLGCTLYAMVVGEPPFKGNDPLSILVAVASSVPEIPATVAAAIPASLSRLMMKMLARDPNDRPADAVAVVAALRAIESDLAASPPSIPASTPSKTNRWWRRGLIAIGGAAAIALAAIVYFVPNANGVLRIEINDDDIEVRLTHSGAIVKGTGDKHELRIAPGQHGLEVTHGDLKLQVPRFEIKNGETVTLRAELLQGNLVVSRMDGPVLAEAARPVRPEPPTLPVAVRPPVPSGPASKSPFPPMEADWLQAVARLTPEAQVEAVIADLKKRNPGFDGFHQSIVVRGVVAELRLDGEKIVDLTPVRGLTDLKILSLSHRPGERLWKMPLADLTPLVGLRLESLDVSGTKVSDLRPLTGMPLKRLDLRHTTVSDLTPIRGAPLVFLDILDTNVYGIEPLRGAPLEKLCCSGYVTDLSPLQGMKIRWLESVGNRVGSLAPLKGMPLEYLTIAPKQAGDVRVFTDLDVIKDLPLRELYLVDFDRVRDGPIVRAVRTLETINYMPAQEFWNANPVE